MSMFTRIKESFDRRRAKAEERTINNVATASKSIEELKARKKMLKEREDVFNQKDKLEREVKETERQVKDLEYRQNNPVMARLKQNINERLKQSKQKGGSFKPKPMGADYQPRNPFSGAGDNPFAKSASGSYNNPFNSSVGSNPFKNSEPKKSTVKTKKTIVIRYE